MIGTKQLLPFVKEQYDVTHKCGVYNNCSLFYVPAEQISMCAKPSGLILSDVLAALCRSITIRLALA